MAVVIFLCLFQFALGEFESGVKVDANNPFAFKMFENFVETEKAFINETILYDQLTQLRSTLQERRILLQEMKEKLDRNESEMN